MVGTPFLAAAGASVMSIGSIKSKGGAEPSDGEGIGSTEVVAMIVVEAVQTGEFLLQNLDPLLTTTTNEY